MGLHQPPTNDPADETDFASILRNSILRTTTHKANCPICYKMYSVFESKRSIASKDLPPILALNAAVFNEESLKFWADGKRQTFLNTKVEMRGQVDGVDDPETVEYELKVTISLIFNSSAPLITNDVHSSARQASDSMGIRAFTIRIQL